MNYYPRNAVDRQNAYGACRAGRAWSIGDQTAAAPASYTAQTALVATTPFLLFYRTAVEFRHIIRRIELAQTGTVAGGAITLALAMDTANRFSAGGTVLADQNMNRGFRTNAMTNLVCRVNATATAQVDANLDWLKCWTANEDIGSTITLDFEDGLMLENTAGSILLYVFAATTAPTLYVNADVIEESYEGGV